jgi:hypothetical protein
MTFLTGPWRHTVRRFGYVVLDARGAIVASVESASPRPGDRERHIAAVIAALPEIVDVLQQAEAYFGDLPAGQHGAEELYRQILAAMTRADITIVDD